MANKHREPLGRRLDRALFTRPLFETVLFENRLTVADRAVVVAWTLRSVAKYRWNQLRSVTGEMADIILFRVLARGRVPCTGMTPLLGAGALVWYQVTDWSVAQRVRRAFGRVSMRYDCTTLYCGWRQDAKRDEPLPVFVLLDAGRHVLEVAYADIGEHGVDSLSPGVGPDLRPMQAELVPALMALAIFLGVKDFDDQLSRFTDT
ncbi:hypothetical protein [Devosia salina]|uniref:Uncharacterized protein n=1 Tax=Devosia salina TaxID=2860336 RepID=A0ABX8WC95_9HYPH|nr:hypothetical protein [Devosia salina]QYO75601.1 hypothetical protein K1X15_13270 [Devosia salina]